MYVCMYVCMWDMHCRTRKMTIEGGKRTLGRWDESKELGDNKNIWLETRMESTQGEADQHEGSRKGG